MLEVFRAEEERLGSKEPTGELLCVLMTLRKPPGLASVVREREGSTSLPTNASRLIETAARLKEPFDRPRNVELDNCMAKHEVQIHKDDMTKQQNIFICKQLKCELFTKNDT